MGGVKRNPSIITILNAWQKYLMGYRATLRSTHPSPVG